MDSKVLEARKHTVREDMKWRLVRKNIMGIEQYGKGIGC